MHLDKNELKVESNNCNSKTNSDRANAVWKMFQESTEPCKTAVWHSVTEACNKPVETALAALGIAATTGAVILTSRIPGAAGVWLPRTLCFAGGVGYAQNAVEVFAPAIGTWKHPQNRSQNADEFGA